MFSNERKTTALTKVVSQHNMRLTPAQIDTIKSTAQALLGEDVQVTLFGSRVDDSAKGGDVGLSVLATQADMMENSPNDYNAISAIIF
jgi:hypothetical protein